MLDDLLHRQLHVGMTHPEITALLGASNHADTDSATPVETFWLVDRPYPHQLPDLLLRWHTTDPVLRIQFRNNRVLAFWVE